MTTWGDAFKSGDPTEISKILDENFKHINLHQPERGFDTLQESLDWIKTKPGIISDIKTIYEDESIDIYYRDLSRILSVLKDDLSSFDQQKLLLEPILNSPSKLQIVAAELEVLLFIRFDKIKDAQKALDVLLKRSDISFDQKNRLELINKIYKNNAE